MHSMFFALVTILLLLLLCLFLACRHRLNSEEALIPTIIHDPAANPFPNSVSPAILDYLTEAIEEEEYLNSRSPKPERVTVPLTIVWAITKEVYLW